MTPQPSTRGSLASIAEIEPPEQNPFRIAAALRRAFAKGYRAGELRADIMAGAVVGVVALPLSMALAIAVGVGPRHGLYTAIVAGAIVALLGGCKFQVTGPTAAFVVILAPIVGKYGLAGLLTAGFLAGLILIVLGVARLGSLIRFIPYPVTTGFTTGIGVVIATLQIKDVLGLKIHEMPEHYTGKIAALWHARGTVSISDFTVAAITFALLLLVPKVIKRVPAPLIAITAVTGGVALLGWLMPSFSVVTIGTRFPGDVGGAPTIGLPWGNTIPSWDMVQELVGPAFAIAMLGAIESLLSAVIADGMTNTKHDPNAELFALGVGNLLAPLFGGIAATGALARTATNIRAGARSPISSVMHAVVVLLSILLLSRLVSYVPMASLAALLLLVAYNMSELHSFIHIGRVAPRSDVLVLVTCFLLTVFFDMVIAVSVGFMLAAILFMRRMSDLTESRVKLDVANDAGLTNADGVIVYEINGPLFFGAAQNAMALLGAIKGESFDVLVLHLGRVPVIDATGFVALENSIASIERLHKRVVVAGPLPKPKHIFDRAKLTTNHPGLRVTETLQEGLAVAAELTKSLHVATRKDHALSA